MAQYHREAGRLGARAKIAKYGRHENVAPARKAFEDRFLKLIPTDLPEAERKIRAYDYMRLHMTRLALKSAKAARKRREKAVAK